MNIEASIEDAVNYIASGKTLTLKPTGLLSSKSGSLKIDKHGFEIRHKAFGIKAKPQIYKWSEIEEIGVNTIRNTGMLSFVVKYNVDERVAFNLVPEKRKKAAARVAKFMDVIGHEYKYSDGALPDSYGMQPRNLAALLITCLQIFNPIRESTMEKTDQRSELDSGYNSG